MPDDGTDSLAYWVERRHYGYYRTAAELARRHAPEARSALDVGARDTRFLELIDWAERKVALDEDCTPVVAGADNIRCDFFTYSPGDQFDLVFCLQVLEHLDRPAAFLQKLLQTGRVVIVSVPYRWPAGEYDGHPQDPVDEAKLLRWAGRRWLAAETVTDECRDRFVAVFRGGAGAPSPLADVGPWPRPWLAPLLATISAAGVPRRQDRFPERVTAQLDVSAGRTGVTGGSGAHLVRALWRALGFDDRRALGWRLDHKLIQSVVLDHFAPGEPARAWGFGEALHALGRDALIDALLTGDLFVKSGVGHLSGDWGFADATTDALRRLWSGEEIATPDAPADEHWVVQERLRIAAEFRVHSFEDTVLPSLTFPRYTSCQVPAERDTVSGYVQGVLDRLPDGIVGQSLLGWDVARTTDGRYRVIEANFAGYHSAFEPGFQVSGFFQTHPLGPPLLAELCRHLRSGYNADLEFPDQWDSGPPRFDRYARLLRHYLPRSAPPDEPAEIQERIDAVLHLDRSDRERFGFLLRSIEQHGTGLGTLWVAAPDHAAAAVAAFAGRRAVVVPESELVPECATAEQPARVRAVARLALSARTAGRFCLDLTPDVLCARPFTARDLLPGGKALYFRNTSGPEQPYHEAEAVLGRAWPGWSHGSTPFLLCRPAVEALTRHLDTRAGAPGGWRQYLLSRATWGLPFVYFAFLESEGLDERYYVPTDEPLIGNCVWSHDDWPYWTPVRARRTPFFFSVVRPGPLVSPAAVAERLRPYFPAPL